MDDEGCDSDSMTGGSDSSSEGEYATVDPKTFPKFDVTAWGATSGSTAMDYLCLVPFTSTYKPEYEQSFHSGKVKSSCVHRQVRMNKFKSGRTTGRNIADERRLRIAANQNDYYTVLSLLDSGVDICCSDDKDRTPLHFSASQGNERIVKALLDRGANPNQKDAVGNTPLHLAACTGHVPIVTLLLKAGTDLKSVDRYGRTPLTVGKSRLKFLSESKGFSSQHIKDEALQICDMLKTYLNLSGMPSEVNELDRLCDQLRQVNTRQDVDHINLLLSDFAGLTLQKKQSL